MPFEYQHTRTLNPAPVDPFAFLSSLSTVLTFWISDDFIYPSEPDKSAACKAGQTGGLRGVTKDVVWNKGCDLAPRYHMLGSLQTIQNPATTSCCLSVKHG